MSTSIAGSRSPAQRPNIVVFFVDDMGYGDAGCLNPQGRIPTPRIDRFASQGMVFSDAHSSSAVCSPSRYSLLTGRYNWRSTLQAGIVLPYGDPLIAPDRTTIASLVKRAGYHTGCIGKWHLGMGWDFDVTWDFVAGRPYGPAPEPGHDLEATTEQLRLWADAFSRPTTGGPTTRGFDTYFGVDVPNWPPYCYIENDHTVGIPTEYLPSRHLVKNQASFCGPAMPYWHFEQLLPAWAKKADAYIADRATAREPFLLYLPMTSPHTPLAVNAPWIGSSGLDNLYADLVVETDDVFGRVLDSLERHGVADDTLVVFASDNGCAHYIGAHELEAQGHYPSGGLRGYKSDAWDGGHRIPLIVRWPGTIPAGSRTNELVCLTDLAATIADYLALPLSDEEAEDSFSLRRVFERHAVDLPGSEPSGAHPGAAGATGTDAGSGGAADAPVRGDVIHHSISGKFAIRDRRWKLILCPGSGGWTLNDAQAAERGLPLVQLYDMVEDPGETRNLSDTHPDRVRTMVASLKAHVARGRTTPGAPQTNDAEVDIWKLGTMPSVSPAAIDDY